MAWRYNYAAIQILTKGVPLLACYTEPNLDVGVSIAAFRGSPDAPRWLRGSYLDVPHQVRRKSHAIDNWRSLDPIRWLD